MGRLLFTALVLHAALLVSFSSGSQQNLSTALNVDYSWKRIDFVFPSSEVREQAIANGTYNYTLCVPLDGDVWQKGGQRKVFVTLPRGLGGTSQLSGVPATLGTVSNRPDPSNPEARLIAPYPDWSWHKDLASITSEDCPYVMSSVYRIDIDELDRLWVLDSSEVGPCDPKLLVFDLRTNKLLAQHNLSAVATSSSYLLTPIVDLRKNGNKTFVYSADSTGAIIVYDDQTKTSWRVNSTTFDAISANETFTIANTTVDIPDGLFGMAISPLRSNGRTLYYHPLASVSESYVNTSVIRNATNFPTSTVNLASDDFKTFSGKRSSQSAAEAMSPEGVLFSGLLSDLSVTCWNSNKAPFPGAGGQLQVVARNATTLQFPSGMKVRGGRLLVFTSRFQEYAAGTIDWSDVNFRLLSANVDDLTRGTQCAN